MATELAEADYLDILTRYFVKGERSGEVCSPAEPRMDVDPGVVEHLVARTELHDQDYVVFRYFRDPTSVILDIGANYGYSVTSIWRSGSLSRVISFEPISAYRSIFETIAKHSAGVRVHGAVRRSVLGRITEYVDRFMRSFAPRRRFVYQMVALSDEVGELTFHAPVLNGRIVSALTTASSLPNVESLAKNIHFMPSTTLAGSGRRAFQSTLSKRR